MKKLVIVMLVLVVSLVGCTKNDSEDNKEPIEKVEFNVVSATGAPGLAFAQMFGSNELNNDKATFSLEYKEGSSALMAAFSDKNIDAIVAPTNLGAKFYNTDGSFIYGATITWGNIYFATRLDEEFTLESLRGKTIYTFGIGSVPYIVVNNILEGLDVTLENLGDSTSVTSAKLVSDDKAIVMIAEPVLSVVTEQLSQKGVNVKTIDVQNEYSVKNKTINYPQASLFIRKSTVDSSKDVVDYFLDKVKISADYANSNPTETVAYAKKISTLYPQADEVLVKAMPKSNILFTTGSKSKVGSEILFNIIMKGSTSAIIGNKLPDADFYY